MTNTIAPKRITGPTTLFDVGGGASELSTNTVLGEDHITVWYNLATAGSIFIRWGPNSTDLCEAGSYQDDGAGVGSIHLETSNVGIINTIQVIGSSLATGSVTAYLITQD